MSLFKDFKWYDWVFAPLGMYKTTVNLANDLGVNKLLFGKDDERFGPSDATEQAENSALMQQNVIDHAEEREDTAIQRRADDLQAAGINPVLAGGSFGAAESGAAQAQVSSVAQKQQAQAAQTQALASLISSAAMLFMTKGKGGIPVSTTNHSAHTTYVNHAYYLNRK